MRSTILRFIDDRRGATAMEYGLMLTLISMAVVVGAGAVGGKLAFMWGDTSSRLNQALNSH